MANVTAKQIITALGEQDAMEVFAPRTYSGRGMYGAQCLGIDIDRVGQIMELAAILMDAGLETDALVNLGDTMHTDSMGRGMIIYWPSIKLTDEEKQMLKALEDAEDEDEDEEEYA